MNIATLQNGLSELLERGDSNDGRPPAEARNSTPAELEIRDMLGQLASMALEAEVARVVNRLKSMFSFTARPSIVPNIHGIDLEQELRGIHADTDLR